MHGCRGGASAFVRIERPLCENCATSVPRLEVPTNYFSKPSTMCTSALTHLRCTISCAYFPQARLLLEAKPLVHFSEPRRVSNPRCTTP